MFGNMRIRYDNVYKGVAIIVIWNKYFHPARLSGLLVSGCKKAGTNMRSKASHLNGWWSRFHLLLTGPNVEKFHGTWRLRVQRKKSSKSSGPWDFLFPEENLLVCYHNCYLLKLVKYLLRTMTFMTKWFVYTSSGNIWESEPLL